MNFLNKMQRKFGRYAIPNLMMHITILNAIIYVAAYVLGQSQIINYLVMDPSLVLKGQVWRILTFVIVPPAANILTAALMLYFYYFIGRVLENAWGAFKFNVYYFAGLLISAIVSVIFQVPISGTFLNMSLYFAFAMMYPDMQVLLFFILPIKIKYLAWLNAAAYLVSLITGTMSTRIAIIGGLANFFLFFGKDMIDKIRLFIRRIKNKNRY